jgi:putative transposase
MEDETLPKREWLRHAVPASISDRNPVFFITVCCRDRGRNLLARQTVWDCMLEAVELRNQNGSWECPLFLAMPDHVHGIISLDRAEDLTRIVASWKRWIAVKADVVWQKGFFDHRLRSSLAAREKSAYILQNPVREGLVPKAEDWPYRFVNATWIDPEDLGS